MSTRATLEAVTEDKDGGKQYKALGRLWTRREAWDAITEWSERIVTLYTAVFNGSGMQVRGALLDDAQRLARIRELDSMMAWLEDYAKGKPEQGQALLRPVYARMSREKERLM